jgi:hypothetical protein
MHCFAEFMKNNSAPLSKNDAQALEISSCQNRSLVRAYAELPNVSLPQFLRCVFLHPPVVI